MAIRTLRRRVIIREYDLKKITSHAIGPHYGGNSLYDRISFIPLNEENLEKIKVVEILKGKSGPLTQIDPERDFSRPRLLLYHLKDYLYNDKYVEWKITKDEEGYICVQSRMNTPKTRIGWGVFEKDLACRI